MAKIIGCVQVKGGAGRSTVATNLAGELGKIGRTVLIDGDMPQGTASSWAAIRQQEGIGNIHADTASDHRELVSKVGKYRDNADFIVLDGPPRIAEMTRAILLLADLSLVPIGASVPEVWATADVVTIIEEASKVRPVDARIVWTRFRAHTRLAQDLSEQAGKELGMKAMKSTLGFRVAYPEAMGVGRTVAEMPDPNARAEMAALLAEVRRLIRRTYN